MSIQTEIDRISGNVAAAYTALEEKGATMPQTQNSDNLAATIQTLSTGSSIYVTEQKTVVNAGGTWIVRKWSNRYCELWLNYFRTGINVTTAWGNMYAADNAIPAIAFPVSFSAVPVIQVTPMINGNYNFGLFTGKTAPTTSSLGTYGVWRATSMSGMSIRASIYVMGQTVT